MSNIPAACIRCEFPWTVAVQHDMAIEEGSTDAHTAFVGLRITKCNRCGLEFMSPYEAACLARTMNWALANSPDERLRNVLTPSETFQYRYREPKEA